MYIHIFSGYLNGSCTIRDVYNFELSTCVVISAPPRFLVVFLEVPIAIHNYADQKPDAAREDVKNKEPVSLGLSNKAFNVREALQ